MDRKLDLPKDYKKTRYDSEYDKKPNTVSDPRHTEASKNQIDTSKSAPKTKYPDSKGSSHLFRMESDDKEYSVEPLKNFEDAPFSGPILDIIHQRKFDHPNLLQSYTIPVALDHRDIIVKTQGNPGKILAYSLPGICEVVEEKKYLMRSKNFSNRKTPLMLVLCSDKDHVYQVYELCSKLCDAVSLKINCIFEEDDAIVQKDNLKGGVDILISTPERLLEFIERGSVYIESVVYLVVDNTEKMVEMGLSKKVSRIIKGLQPTRQSLFFCSEFSEDILQLAKISCQNNPVRLLFQQEKVAETPIVSKKLEQKIEVLDKYEKIENLLKLQKKLHSKGTFRVLILTPYERSGKKIYDELYDCKYPCYSILQNDAKKSKEKIAEKMNQPGDMVIVALDYNTQGFELRDFNIVVNYDFPTDVKSYEHLINEFSKSKWITKVYSYFTEKDAKNIDEFVIFQKKSRAYIPSELSKLNEKYKSTNLNLNMSKSKNEKNIKMSYNLEKERSRSIEKRFEKKDLGDERKKDRHRSSFDFDRRKSSRSNENDVRKYRDSKNHEEKSYKHKPAYNDRERSRSVKRHYQNPMIDLTHDDQRSSKHRDFDRRRRSRSSEKKFDIDRSKHDYKRDDHRKMSFDEKKASRSMCGFSEKKHGFYPEKRDRNDFRDEDRKSRKWDSKPEKRWSNDKFEKKDFRRASLESINRSRSGEKGFAHSANKPYFKDNRYDKSRNFDDNKSQYRGNNPDFRKTWRGENNDRGGRFDRGGNNDRGGNHSRGGRFDRGGNHSRGGRFDRGGNHYRGGHYDNRGGHHVARKNPEQNNENEFRMTVRTINDPKIEQVNQMKGGKPKPQKRGGKQPTRGHNRGSAVIEQENFNNMMGGHNFNQDTGDMLQNPFAQVDIPINNCMMDDPNVIQTLDQKEPQNTAIEPINQNFANNFGNIPTNDNFSSFNTMPTNQFGNFNNRPFINRNPPPYNNFQQTNPPEYQNAPGYQNNMYYNKNMTNPAFEAHNKDDIETADAQKMYCMFNSTTNLTQYYQNNYNSSIPTLNKQKHANESNLEPMPNYAIEQHPMNQNFEARMPMQEKQFTRADLQEINHFMQKTNFNTNLQENQHLNKEVPKNDD